MKMLKLIPIFFIIVISCSEKEPNSGHIKGDISKLTKNFDKVVIKRMGMPYTGSISNSSDTIEAKNGKFEYDFYIDEPKYTTFYLLENNKRIGHLGFRDKFTYQNWFLGNVLLGNEDITIYVDTIYHINQINGITNYRADIKGSLEAEIFLKSMRKLLISNENIKKYNNSYAMLYHLHDLKDNYSVKQLQDYSKIFSDNIKKSESFHNLQKYIENRINLDKIGYKDNFNWVDVNNKNYNFEQVRNGKEYVFLIFWASWCRPCREEIPELKKFYEKNKNKISMVSLSTDKDYEHWKKALEKENMPWLNLSGLPNNIKKISLEYNITYVPAMILLDKNGKALSMPTSDLNEIIELFNKMNSSTNFNKTLK